MSAPYDVVIVGGGVAGVLVAKILAENGKKVLLLEAGIEGAMQPETYRKYVNAYYTEGASRSMPNGPYPWNEAAPSPGVPNAPSTYYQYATPMHFMSDYLRMLGGSTLHWQGTSLRLVPNDFRMQSVYGKARNWPISYDDLEPAYRRAEFELGVSADVEDQRIFGVWFPKDYVFPMHRMPQSCLDQFLDRALRDFSVPIGGDDYPVSVISIPMARNSAPNNEYDGGKGYTPMPAVGDRDQGQRCQGNSNCLPICPVQAKYSTLKTLQSLVSNDRVEIRTQCVASRLIREEATGRISGVEYKRYDSPDGANYSTEVVQGTLVALTANAVQNAVLLLASNAANSSDQVGRNLMDHPYIPVWGYARHERIYPFRGPDTTSGIESLRDGNYRQIHAAFRASIGNWGWSGAPSSQLSALLAAKTFGKSLRTTLADQMTRMVKIGFMLEQLPSPDNRVTIDGRYMDKLGNYCPVMSYSYDDYTLAGMETVIQTVWHAVVERAQIQDCTVYPDPAPPGWQRVNFNGRGYNLMGSGHIVGTHRMGNNSKDSVTDKFLRSWDHRNLYVIGAGSQVTIGTANPTLTVAALAIRAAESMLRELK